MQDFFERIISTCYATYISLYTSKHKDDEIDEQNIKKLNTFITQDIEKTESSLVAVIPELMQQTTIKKLKSTWPRIEITHNLITRTTDISLPRSKQFWYSLCILDITIFYTTILLYLHFRF